MEFLGVVARAKYLAAYIQRSIGAAERDRHFAHDQFRYDLVENVFRCPQGQTRATAEWTAKHQITFVEITI